MVAAEANAEHGVGLDVGAVARAGVGDGGDAVVGCVWGVWEGVCGCKRDPAPVVGLRGAAAVLQIYIHIHTYNYAVKPYHSIHIHTYNFKKNTHTTTRRTLPEEEDDHGGDGHEHPEIQPAQASAEPRGEPPPGEAEAHCELGVVSGVCMGVLWAGGRGCH